MRLRPLLLALLFVPSLGLAQVARPSDPGRTAQSLREYRRGLRAFGAERFDEAVDAFRKAVKANPDFALAHVMLGHTFMSQRNYEGAVAAYGAAKATYRRLQGEELERQEREFRAEQRALEIVNQNNEDQEGPAGVGGVGVGAGPESAAARLQSFEMQRAETAEHPPGRATGPPPQVSLSLGSAYFRLRRLGEAEREFKEAIAADSHFGEAHNNLALVYYVTGRLAEAREEVRLAQKAGFPVNAAFLDVLK